MTTCTRRSFTSVTAARAAHKKAGYRFRVYPCPECGSFHTTNVDKNGTSDMRPVKGARHGRARNPLELAPIRTFEQVVALAAEMRAQRAG